MKIETMDAEILVGTTSSDLFTEIMDRMPSLTALFESYKREKCDLPPHCSVAHGCDMGPRGRTYCFMNFFKTMMHHDWKNVEEFLDIFDAQEGDGRARRAIDIFIQKKNKEMVFSAMELPDQEFDDEEPEEHGLVSALRRIFGGR